jgi:hypothetical protein
MVNSITIDNGIVMADGVAGIGTGTVDQGTTSFDLLVIRNGTMTVGGDVGIGSASAGDFRRLSLFPLVSVSPGRPIVVIRCREGCRHCLAADTIVAATGDLQILADSSIFSRSGIESPDSTQLAVSGQYRQASQPEPVNWTIFLHFVSVSVRSPGSYRLNFRRVDTVVPYMRTVRFVGGSIQGLLVTFAFPGVYRGEWIVVTTGEEGPFTVAGETVFNLSSGYRFITDTVEIGPEPRAKLREEVLTIALGVIVGTGVGLAITCILSNRVHSGSSDSRFDLSDNHAGM